VLFVEEALRRCGVNLYARKCEVSLIGKSVAASSRG
jgi:hypothetical protein